MPSKLPLIRERDGEDCILYACLYKDYDTTEEKTIE